MAEPLKNAYGPEIAAQLARLILQVSPSFPRDAFLAEALAGYDTLELMDRGRRLCAALHHHLPPAYPDALAVLMASVAITPRPATPTAMAPFFYLPHTMFVATHGQEHFALSMAALHTLTQHFTGEFAIRPFLMTQPEATLAQLEAWTTDPNPHVRRLVSEGTRPRLPWAPRLKAFQADPTPVLRLLDRLKDDPELYVRRSVANNLGDIAKDHPDIAVETARGWLDTPTPERRWIVQHGLRSAVKKGDRATLDLLGFEHAEGIRVGHGRFDPPVAPIGGAVHVAFEVENTRPEPQRVLVDLRVHFVKAGGKTGAKVFKLKALDLAPGQVATVGKTVSLAEMTTRKHHAGHHRVEALVSGAPHPLGGFDVHPAAPTP